MVAALLACRVCAAAPLPTIPAPTSSGAVSTRSSPSSRLRGARRATSLPSRWGRRPGPRAVAGGERVLVTWPVLGTVLVLVLVLLLLPRLVLEPRPVTGRAAAGMPCAP